MLRRTIIALLCAVVVWAVLSVATAQAQQAYGRQWGHSYSTQDWNRLYHYPYVYYPQNFWGPDYYRSSDDMYFRYPPEMRIPVYNRQWQNFYPDTSIRFDRLSSPRYQQGYHFVLDTF